MSSFYLLADFDVYRLFILHAFHIPVFGQKPYKFTLRVGEKGAKV